MCWSHSRRKFFVLADVAKVPLALEAVRRIDAIFAIEREINGRAAAERCAVRQARVAPLVAELGCIHARDDFALDHLSFAGEDDRNSARELGGAFHLLSSRPLAFAIPAGSAFLCCCHQYQPPAPPSARTPITMKSDAYRVSYGRACGSAFQQIVEMLEPRGGARPHRVGCVSTLSLEPKGRQSHILYCDAALI